MAERPSWIGKTLGDRYRIDEILGQGGMSAVYKANDPNLRRVVAIKLIHSYLADDPRFVARFEEEAAAVAQLRHPNIVQVYDFNHDGDVYYMVQEFIPGETLQERLRRLIKSGRQMAIDEGCKIIVEICQATGYAHNRGMVHRDIKPANIMINVQSEAILMDFGIVKIMGGDRHTATGAVVGTALYLAPEVIRGETADARSDIYSLGVTLFEVLSGKPPFQSDSAMTLMMMHLNDPVPNLQELRQDIPIGLVRVIETALAKDRSTRYQSMVDMAADINAALAGKQVSGTAMRTVADNLPVPPAPQPAPGSTVVDSGGNIHTSSPQIPADQPPAPTPASVSGAMGTVIEDREGRTFVEMRPALDQSKPGGSVGTSDTPASVYGIGAADSVSPAAPSSNNRIYMVAGAVAVALIVIFAVVYFTFLRGDGNGVPLDAALPTDTTEVTLNEAADTPQPEAALLAEDTPTPTITTTPTLTPTTVPTATPTLGLPPTATFPAGIPFVYIKTITTNDSGRYVVEYDTLEYVEELPGVHIHFFFNTISQEEAGSPGKGPWILYGGPRPFTGYRQDARPKTAAQMCALVANANHSIQFDSGNCMILPDINAVTILADTLCLAGAESRSQAVSSLLTGDVLLVNGISPDESWWNVYLPDSDNQNCWVPVDRSYFHGDLSTVQLVQPPPSSQMSVEITGITLNDQNQLVVDYKVSGFEQSLPGTHIHFFFDTVQPEDVGMSGGGNRLMFGGPSPFTGYSTSDRPDGAGKMCALVAQPDHSVLLDSGNCYNLP